MRRFTAINCLTIVTVLAGFASAVSAAAGNAPAQGIFLGAAAAFGAVLVRLIARDSKRISQQQGRLISSLPEELKAVSLDLAKVKRHWDKKLDNLDRRIESESSRATVRILGDVNAARLELIDVSRGAAETAD